jgi:polar amino acid transport system substrate-binding protein
MSSQEPSVIARVAAQNPIKEIEPKFTIVEFEVGVGMRRNNEALAEYVNG